MSQPQAHFPWHSAGADIDGPYRYRLWREWARALGRCVFVMLNPSTADADQDDPTIRRCIRFATDWGYGRLDVVNLLAWRATDPDDLSDHALLGADPIGPRNDEAILAACAGAQLVVAAWGATIVKVGFAPRVVCLSALRSERVLQDVARVAPIHSLGQTRTGAPRHPLYVAAHTRPLLFRERTVSSA